MRNTPGEGKHCVIADNSKFTGTIHNGWCIASINQFLVHRKTALSSFHLCFDIYSLIVLTGEVNWARNLTETWK